MRTMFEPAYTLVGDELKAGVGLQVVRSSNRTLSPNQDSSRAFLDWLRRSDSGSVGISSRYEEIATREAGIDSAGSVPAGSTRASRTLSGLLNRALSERSTIILNGAYEGVSYKVGPFVDYSARSAGMRFNYAWSERATPFLEFSGVKFTPEGEIPSSSLVGAVFGLIGKFESVDVTMQLGKSRTSGSHSEWQGLFATQYAGQQTQLTFTAERMTLPSGLGEFAKVDQIRGGWVYDLSEYYKTGIDMVSWENRSLIFNNVRTTTGIWLQRDISSFWSVRTYYSHINTRGGGFGAYSNIIGLSLIYANPDF